MVSFLFVLFFFVLPVFGAQVKNEVLVNGTGIFIESGGSWEFSQGYVFVVKDVSEDGGAWVELSLEGVILKDEILYGGDQFVYSHDSIEIFNMTVDTVYYGPDGELITFIPVFQYLDPSLPAPVPEDSEISSNGSDTPLIPDGTPAESIPGFGLVMALSAMLVLFTCSRVFGGK